MLDPNLRTAADRRTGWPSWLVSVLTHGTLIAVVLWLTRDLPVRGAAGQPTREVGIVLKSMTEAGPKFEGEDDYDSDSAADSESLHAQTALEALPEPSESPSGATALPQLPQIGPGDLSESGVADAGAVAGGGAPARRGGGGGDATVNVFGIEGVGTRFVYVFDQSVSMEGRRLAAAKRELIQSLNALDAIHQFQIIFFNDRVNMFDLTGGGQRIASGTDRDKALAKRFVNGVAAAFGTRRTPALQAALRFQPDVIFFLTDADHPMDPYDLNDIVRQARRSGTAIQCIEFGDGPQAAYGNFLTQLAEKTGGKHGYIDAQRLGR